MVDLFSRELISGGADYWREFCVSNWVGLINKKSLKQEDNNLKQLKTINPNSPYGLVFGTAYYRKDICA